MVIGGWGSAWFLVPAAVAVVALLLAGFLWRRGARGSSPGAALGRLPAALLEELWVWDVADDRMRVPPGILQLTGFEADAFGTGVGDLGRHLDPTDSEAMSERLRGVLAGSARDFAMEFKLNRRDGTALWLAVRAEIERDDAGMATRVSGTWSDVTARVEAEEERDRLFNVSIDLLAVAGFDGFLQQVNPAWVRVLGWSRDELMSRRLAEFIHPEDQDLAIAALAALAEGHPVTDLATRFRCRDGSYRWLSWASFPYPDRRLVFSVVRDISGQKDAEQRLLDYQDRLRAMGSQLASAEERERRHLAVAIHDGLAQLLFAARAKVTLLRYPGKVGDPGVVVDEAIGILDDAMREARSLSFELYPPVLYEVGLEAALSWLARQWSERTGIRCTVDAAAETVDPLAISEDTRALVYQSVRELLANAFKHAAADEVRIELQHQPHELRVAVADNGGGFDSGLRTMPAGAPGDGLGFGLFSIRERLRSVGGRFHLETRPGAGSRIELKIPLDGGDQAAPNPGPGA